VRRAEQRALMEPSPESRKEILSPPAEHPSAETGSFPGTEGSEDGRSRASAWG